MALIRALNSGVSGLRSFQTKMDVIGNNIANVETAGFKASRVTFAELMNQRLGRADAGGESSPQTNNQVGLGVRVASIDRDFSQGVMQSTGRGTDLAIDGRGYFLVHGQAQNYLTRAGNFVFNKDGFLVDPGGRFVQGYTADRDGNVQPGGRTDNIRVDFENVFQPRETSEVVITGNLSGDEGTSRVMSTTIYDSLGNAHSVVIEFTKQPVDPANPDDTQNLWSYDIKFADFDPQPGPPLDGTDGFVRFGPDGNLLGTCDAQGVLDVPASSQLSIGNFDPDNGADTLDFTIHLGKEDQGVGFSQYAGSNTAKVLSQDGYGQGQLLDVAIDGEGRLVGIYNNGQNQTLAQIAIAQVQNDNGLDMLGGGLFRPTSAAGELFITSAESLAETSINSGNLEGSNVDLAKEFTEMITSQRAYQSNARVISTADDMLMEAVNLKR